MKRSEFYQAYSAIRSHRSQEEKNGYRIAMPECYYDKSGQIASSCLGARRSYERDYPKAGRFATPEKRRFEKMIKVFFPATHA